uniref:Somatostatin receptor type 5-like n=1 Tax=Phallusia mammillata TaxID=59560 RepID=A0A6F9DUB2_9ASCI|nr:somatostatin receptor type 5-like [Phallusia mammillata]
MQEIMSTTANPENDYEGHSHGNTTLTDFPSSTLTSIILPIIFYTVFVIGFLGNGLVVYVMYRMRSSKKIADLFVVNLAIADLIFLGTLPFWATEYLMGGNWVFGRTFCKLTSTLTLFSAYGSVFFLSMMAVDRLGVVVFYKRYNHRRTTKKAIVVILLLWMASTVTSLVALYFRDTEIDHATGHTHCRWYFDESLVSHKAWYCIHFILRFIVGFGVPLSITVICYIVIFMYLRGRRSKKKLLRKKQDRVTLTVLVVIVVFIICWMPNQISNFIYVAQGLEIIDLPGSDLQYYIHLFANTLAWAHSCFNPFLYAFMREDVRHKFVEITNNCLPCGRTTYTPQVQRRITQSTKLSTLRKYRTHFKQTQLCVPETQFPLALEVKLSRSEIDGNNKEDECVLPRVSTV